MESRKEKKGNAPTKEISEIDRLVLKIGESCEEKPEESVEAAQEWAGSFARIFDEIESRGYDTESPFYVGENIRHLISQNRQNPDWKNYIDPNTSSGFIAVRRNFDPEGNEGFVEIVFVEKGLVAKNMIVSGVSEETKRRIASPLGKILDVSKVPSVKGASTQSVKPLEGKEHLRYTVFGFSPVHEKSGEGNLLIDLPVSRLMIVVPPITEETPPTKRGIVVGIDPLVFSRENGKTMFLTDTVSQGMQVPSEWFDEETRRAFSHEYANLLAQTGYAMRLSIPDAVDLLSFMEEALSD